MAKPFSFANFKTIIADFEKTTPKMLQMVKFKHYKQQIFPDIEKSGMSYHLGNKYKKVR